MNSAIALSKRTIIPLLTNYLAPLTTGSNRSLRSLGPAKAGPLTKRYAGAEAEP
jgi:hypothetical protein